MIIFVVSLLVHNLVNSLLVYFSLSIILILSNVKILYREIKEIGINKSLLFNSALFLFVFYLFNRSFSYDSIRNTFLIHSNLYLDFGAHIPFIRFFSVGQNFYPEVPFYAGGRLFYHFMFDFYASILEFIGLRIDYAFNLISALSFFFLLNIIFNFTTHLFKNKIVGFLACLFFIFNSDLSFIQIFKKYGISLSKITYYYHHNIYPQGDLLGLAITGNFLNINAYLNQRHLIFALLWFFYIFFALLFFKKKELDIRKSVLLAVMIGIFPFWHLQALISIYVVLLALGVLFKNLRKEIVCMMLISFPLVLPQLFLIKISSLNQVIFSPGFMVSRELSIKNFLFFWIWNLGLTIPISILGFLKSNTLQKKIFLAFFVLFIFANTFIFTRDIFDNHKFFNIWIIIVNMFAAWGIINIFKKNVLFKGTALLAIILMILSGFFHFLVVKNDVYAKVPDYPLSKLMKWVKSNIPGDEIFFTNGDIYDPASVMGRRTFLGRSHYVFLYGGDPGKRIKERSIILEGKDENAIRKILTSYRIKYIVIYKKTFIINRQTASIDFLKAHFKKLYEDNQGTIFKI